MLSAGLDPSVLKAQPRRFCDLPIAVGPIPACTCEVLVAQDTPGCGEAIMHCASRLPPMAEYTVPVAPVGHKRRKSFSLVAEGEA